MAPIVQGNLNMLQHTAAVCYTLHTLLQPLVCIFCTVPCCVLLVCSYTMKCHLGRELCLATPTPPVPLPQRSALGTMPTQTCSTHNEGLTVPAVRGTLWLCRSSRWLPYKWGIRSYSCTQWGQHWLLVNAVMSWGWESKETNKKQKLHNNLWAFHFINSSVFNCFAWVHGRSCSSHCGTHHRHNLRTYILHWVSAYGVSGFSLLAVSCPHWVPLRSMQDGRVKTFAMPRPMTVSSFHQVGLTTSTQLTLAQGRTSISS